MNQKHLHRWSSPHNYGCRSCIHQCLNGEKRKKIHLLHQVFLTNNTDIYTKRQYKSERRLFLSPLVTAVTQSAHIQWNPDLSNPQGKRKLINNREFEISKVASNHTFLSSRIGTSRNHCSYKKNLSARLKNLNNVRKESLALSPRVIYVVALTFFKYQVYLDIVFHLL